MMRAVDLTYVGPGIRSGKERRASPEMKVSSWQSR
jgi:hypothetical protein